MDETIENKVAKANILQIDLKDFLFIDLIEPFDIQNALWQGLILKEEFFRDYIKNYDWLSHKNQYVAVFCSEDTIIPSWAYMLISVELNKVNAKPFFGNLNQIKEELFFQNLNQINLLAYKDQRVMVKGCSEIPNPDKAYFNLTNLLIPVVKSLMFGEPCSAVPVYKKK